MRDIASLLAVALLTGCTQHIWPGDESIAKAECVTHASLARFSSTSEYTTARGWHPRYDYVLYIVCRDGSTHYVDVRKEQLR